MLKILSISLRTLQSRISRISPNCFAFAKAPGGGSSGEANIDIINLRCWRYQTRYFCDFAHYLRPLSKISPFSVFSPFHVTMSPSSGSRFYKLFIISFFVLQLCPLIQAEYHNFNEIFLSARQFETAPSEGITLLSTDLDSIDLFLNEGETDEVTYNFVFMPPTGSTPYDYSLSFSCDNDLIYSSSSCTLSSIIADIVTSSQTVYNTTVSCVFSKFPGTTECNLMAIPSNANIDRTTTSVLSLNTTTSERKSLQMTTVSFTNSSDPSTLTGISNVSVHQTAVYISDPLICNVFGIVFYLLDSFGERGSSSTIVSGLSNSYKMISFDRIDAGVREVQVYSVVPGGADITGSNAMSFFSSATISLNFSDVLFRYDAASCSFTDAFISSGEVTLPSSDTCGMGIAVDNEGSQPVLGVQFRVYKSGSLSVSLMWPSLGTSTENYEQLIVFEILEAAPPIITDISKANTYRSVPCESETITIKAYNIRYADERTVVVANSDGSASVWSEVTQLFSYNSETDSSTAIFESAGGSGTNTGFVLNCTFISDVRQAIVFNNMPLLTLSFSSPPSLTSMIPTVSDENGGDTILLTGNFEGFGDEDIVYIGGYIILGSSTNLTGTTQISFFSPKLSDLGEDFSYDVTVSICAELSESISLTYLVPPEVTISSTNSSPNDKNAYVIPSGGSSTFVAEVTGNNNGLFYVWQVFQSDGSQVSVSATNDEEVFIVSEEMLSSTEEIYTLRVEVINSLNLADFDEVSIQLTSTEFITANVYETSGTLYRSADSATLVQSEVTTSSDEEIVLEWVYKEGSYTVDNNAVTAQQFTNDSSTTGPSKLGLEFNIANEDLTVGTSILILKAHLKANPSIAANDSITIRVKESPLFARINDGINGTLVALGSNIRLSASESKDPDVLRGEGDSTRGFSYKWGPCVKSLDSSFNSATADCTSMLPATITSEVITVSGSSIEREFLESNSSFQDSTFFSFGLQITKGRRQASSYIFFEVRGVSNSERIPLLSSLGVVDSHGALLDTREADGNGDIIIQPTAAESIVEWRFDMVDKRHKYMFAMNGFLKVGTGFVSKRNEISTLPLGFIGGKLKPATEYTVLVIASAQDTSIETEYQVSFRTAEVPKLVCNPPQIQIGIVSSTSFTVKALLSFQTQKIDFCFFLTSQTNERFPIGRGCSFLSFATFTFPREGVYSIECVAKTFSGTEIDRVLLIDAIELFAPPTAVDLTQIDYLSQRLDNLTTELNKCETRRDHSCINSLILSANDFSLLVERAVSLDSSPVALDLLERCREHIERLSGLSDALASRTIIRPNEVEQSIDQSLYLAHVPSLMITTEKVLYDSLSQVNGVVDSISSGVTDSILSDNIVDKVTSISNLTMTKAYNIDQGGTTRTRLRAIQADSAPLFATILFPLLRNIWSIRIPQEACGFRGFQLSEYPLSLSGVVERADGEALNVLPAVKFFTGIVCGKNQLAEPFGDSFLVKVCQEAIGKFQTPRVEVIVAGIPEEIVAVTGMAEEVTPYVRNYVYIGVNGLSSLPHSCLELSMERKRSSLTATVHDNLVAGVLTNLTVSAPNKCTKNTCYTLLMDKNDTTTFTSQRVLVSTRNQGLYIAGNLTRAKPYSEVIEGVTGTGALATALGILGMFAVVAGLVTWIAATTCVVVLPGVDEVGWEYVERDMFGRGSVEALAFGPSSMSSIADTTTVGSTFTALARQKSTEAYERKSTNMLFG